MNKILTKILLGSAIVLSFLVFPASNVVAANFSSITSKAVLEGAWQCLQGGGILSSFKASTINSGFVRDINSTPVKLPYGQVASEPTNGADCKELMFSLGGASKGGLLPKYVWSNNGTKEDREKTAKYFAGDNLAGGSGNGIGYKAEAITPEIVGEAQSLHFEVTSTPSDCGQGGIANSKLETIEPKITLYKSGGGSGEDIGKTIIFPTVVKDASGGNKVNIDGSKSYNVPAPRSGQTYQYQTTCGGATFNIRDTSDSNTVSYSIMSDSGQVNVNTNYSNKNGAQWVEPNYFSASGHISKNIQGGTTEQQGLLEADTFITLTPTIIRERVTNKSSFAEDYNITWLGYGNNLIAGLNRNNGLGYSVSNLTHAGQLALTRQEIYDLYTYYITDVFGASVACEGSQNYESYANESSINWSTCGECKIKKSTAIDPAQPVYGVDMGTRRFTKKVGLQDVIDGLGALGDLSDLSVYNVCNDNSGKTKSKTGSSNSTTVDEDFCDKLVDEGTDGEGIGAMQWVLCPSLTNTTYTANWIDNMSQDMLEVKSSLYEPGSDTQEAWGKVRDVANVAMVLFLLVIIFSQLTGYGIDNYGIKKMLPRLITMAIIVNLSFYICAIAVDVSNIAGTGLRDLFGGIGAGISGDAVDANTGFISTSVVGLFSAAGIGGGAAVGAAGTAVTLGAPLVVAILIAAFVLVLVIIVAVVILYLMLGVREIIVIFCILISPLAFAAFILPNTQHLFKKWLDLFKAALIIFPICGAVSGISFILKDITIGPDVGVGTKAVMMVLPFVGFFFLPELLKQAISALGKLGGAITSMGNTMRGGARTLGNGAARLGKSTEWYKNLEREGHRTNVMRRQNRLNKRFDKAKERADRGGSFAKWRFEQMQTGRAGRKYARADQTADALKQEDIKASEVLMNRQYTDESLQDLVALSDKAAEAGDFDRMDALNNLIFSRHSTVGAKAIADNFGTKEYFDAKGNFKNGHMEQMFGRLRDNLSKNTGLGNAIAGKSSDVSQMLTSGGYYDDGSGVAKRGNLNMHSKYNGAMTKDSDRAVQGASTLRRAFAANAMGREDAERMLNSTDNSIVSGILSEDDKVNMLMAAAEGYNKWGKDFNKDEVEAYANQWKTKHPGWDKRAENAMKANQAMIDMAANVEKLVNGSGGGTNSNGA